MQIEEYKALKNKLIDLGYTQEIVWVQSRKLEELTKEHFLSEYIWVVINAGMKEQVARKIFIKVISHLDDPEKIRTVFGHKGKVEAIINMIENVDSYFKGFVESKDSFKIKYLEGLKWIGPITKYHLARNFGMDVIKPDRHLERIAKAHSTTPFILCRNLSRETGDRIGVVDVILWRSANLGLI